MNTEIIMYEEPNTSQEKKFIIQVWLDFGPASSFLLFDLHLG